jgi:hypothetical protein
MAAPGVPRGRLSAYSLPHDGDSAVFQRQGEAQWPG